MKTPSDQINFLKKKNYFFARKVLNLKKVIIIAGVYVFY